MFRLAKPKAESKPESAISAFDFCSRPQLQSRLDCAVYLPIYIIAKRETILSSLIRLYFHSHRSLLLFSPSPRRTAKTTEPFKRIVSVLINIAGLRSSRAPPKPQTLRALSSLCARRSKLNQKILTAQIERRIRRCPRERLESGAEPCMFRRHSQCCVCVC